MNEIPVIFFHLGNNAYLKHTLAQACSYNKRVVLLGDESNCDIHSQVEHHHHLTLHAPDDDLQEWSRAYQHFSSNDERFERLCIGRWFIIRNFLLKNNLKECVYLDSDIMTYTNFTEQAQDFSGKKAAFMYPSAQPEFRWGASGHSSYWTLDGLTEFCEFIKSLYATQDGLIQLVGKWNWHVANHQPGGICDMSLLHLFYQQHSDDILNLSEVRNRATYDDNINSSENHHPEEYRMKGGYKEIKWEDGIPYGYNLQKKSWCWTRFNTLHFQGPCGKMLLDSVVSAPPRGEINEK